MEKLSQEQLETALVTLPEWHLQDGQLVREWKFAGFVEAIAFVGRVADLAETMNHHPDIDIRYDRVRLALVTHDAGGITKRDIKFSAEADAKL